MRNKLTLLWLLTLCFARPVAAQTTHANDLTAIYHSFAGHEPRLAADERIGQSIWIATAQQGDTVLGRGYAAFMDNDCEENELLFPEVIGQRAGLLDALWTIQPGQTNWGKLVLYSDGEVLCPVDSLEQGRYEVNYVRAGKPIKVSLDRP